MLTRRPLLAACAAYAALAIAAPRAWSQAGGGEATNFIVTLGNRMVQIINAPGSQDQKKAQISTLLETSVDIQSMAMFCLGRYARTATPDQRARYVTAFQRALVDYIAQRLGQYQGVTFAPTTTTAREGMFYVGTSIRQPNQQPNNVQWVVSMASGQPKIEDVVAEGTSLRITRRSDYTAFLDRNGGNLEALLTAMARM